MRFFTVLFSLICFIAVSFAATPTILSPENNAAIKPGANFDFKYQSIADYGTSSYNFTVWLFTSPPQGDFVALNEYASGFYMGRFCVPNYPGNPYPSNPPPRQLTMPNLSKLGNGFGSSVSTANAEFYLTVLEEYGTVKGSVGYKISLVYNTVRYNATGN